MRRLLNVSRPCYDKFHRCPGGSGGGIHYARRDQCDGGYLGAHYDVPHWKWKTTRCPSCGVLVLPSVVRWIDPGYLVKWKLMSLPGRFEDWRYERQLRRVRQREK